jgi:hypothetical protein
MTLGKPRGTDASEGYDIQCTSWGCVDRTNRSSDVVAEGSQSGATAAETSARRLEAVLGEFPHRVHGLADET